MENRLSFSFLDYTFEMFSDNDDDDDESYIEIDLDSIREHSEEFDFRVSFSSEIFSQSPTQKPFQCSFPSSDFASATSGIASSDRISCKPNCLQETSTEEQTSIHQNIKQRRLKFLSIFRQLFTWSLKGSSDIGEEKNRPDNHRQLILKAENPELLVRSRRKASKMSKAINGRIIKLLIKFQPEKIRSTLVSLLKPYQFNNKITEESQSKQHGRIIKPFHKRLVSNNDNNNDKRKNDKSWKKMEINVDAIRGVLEAVNLTINGRKGKGIHSCPSSIISSPNGQGTALCQNRSYAIRESSVHAAIDHCKRSFI